MKSLKGLKPKTKHIIKSRQAHESLGLLLRRQGLRGLDPNSFEGQYVEHLLTLYGAGINTNLPPAYVEAIVEVMVGAIIGQRSAFEFIISQRAPSISTTEDGRAQRQAWQMALSSWRTFSDTILKCTKELRPEETGPKTPISIGEMFHMMQEAKARAQAKITITKEDDTPLVPKEIQELLAYDLNDHQQNTEGYDHQKMESKLHALDYEFPNDGGADNLSRIEDAEEE